MQMDDEMGVTLTFLQGVPWQILDFLHYLLYLNYYLGIHFLK